MFNKRKRGKSTGINNRNASTGDRQRIQDRTNTRLRQKERAFEREAVKAHRADSDIPTDPHPTVGGWYAF